jgi:hypothetical protein
VHHAKSLAVVAVEGGVLPDAALNVPPVDRGVLRPLKSIIRLFKKHEKAYNYEGMNNNIYRGDCVCGVSR